MAMNCAMSTMIITALWGVSAAWADVNAAVSDEGLRDVRAPVAFPSNYALLLAVLGVLLAALLIRFLWLRRKMLIKEPAEFVDTRNPWEIAYEQLDRLSKSSYLNDGRFKEYYSELSGIVRCYFENRFAIRAPEMTTEEFLWSLERTQELKTEHKETLVKFMTSCDIVKFAKHIPRVEEAAESFRFARQLVDETKLEES